jgi:CRP-like cAMP-binding protein
MENRLLEIAYQSVRQRVANALLKISLPNNMDDKFVITTTRKDIANIVGTATESLNRTLADFKDEGLIEISGDGLRIVNRPKLERVLR